MILGLVSVAWPQEILVWIQESPSVTVQRNLRLQLRIPGVEPNQIGVLAPPFPSDLTVNAGPSLRSSTWAREDGQLSSGTLASWALSAVRPGIYPLPGFRFFAGGRPFIVRETFLSVVSREEEGLRFPLELEWVRPTSVWAGQSVFVALRVKNLETVPDPDFPLLPLGQDALVAPLAEGVELSQRSLGGYRLLDLIWGRWLVTPLRPGRLVVGPFTVNIAGVRKSLPELVLQVQPLPTGSSLGAVGRFTRTLRLESEPESGTYRLIQRLEGVGNLALIELPQPRGAGFTLISVEDFPNYRPTPLGYEGSLERRFLIRRNLSEPGNLQVPPFTYFDPASSTSVTLEGKDFDLGAPLPTSEKPVLPPWPTADEVARQAHHGLLFAPLSYLFLLPGVVVFLLLLLWPSQRTPPLAVVLLALLSLTPLAQASGPWRQVYDQAREAFEQGQFLRSLSLLDTLIAEQPQLPLLRLSRAIVLRELGQRSKACADLILAVREGVRHPLLDETATALDLAEALNELQPSSPLVGDALFLLSIATTSLFLAFLGLGVRRVSFLGLSAAAILFGLTIWGWAAAFQWLSIRNQPLAVSASPRAALRKIPDHEASAFAHLREGEMVYLLGRAGDFRRARTALGLEGWVDRGDLLEITSPGR